MYNLIRFIARYHILILFLLLELFCFYLIFTNNQYHQVAFINKANMVNGHIYQAQKGVTDYLSLKEVNDSLAKENARLHALTLESLYDNHVRNDSARDTVAGKWIQQFTYTSARVIRNSTSQTSNYVYIDRGKLQGIEKQMGVICPNGIVGQVVNCTDNYSVIMSVLNKDFKVSAKLKKSNYFGNLFWQGKNPGFAKLEEIPKHVKVAVGDTIVTSGYSTIFPQNIMIGKITSVETAPEKNFMEIEVRLSTDFNNLSYVYVIRNLQKAEILHLDTLQKPQ